MFIYTAVAPLWPLQHRHEHSPPENQPPDVLSGGDREVVASYTAFRYSGNFSEVARRLIDSLPHPGASKNQKKKGDIGDDPIGITRLRHACGEYIFYLLLAGGLALFCVADQSSGDEEAFLYLETVKTTVTTAVDELRSKGAERIRKAASLALVESMNTLTSQSAGSSFGSQAPPQPIYASGGKVGVEDGRSGNCDVHKCLAEAARGLQVQHTEQRSTPQPQLLAAPPPSPPAPASIPVPPPGVTGPTAGNATLVLPGTMGLHVPVSMGQGPGQGQGAGRGPGPVHQQPHAQRSSPVCGLGPGQGPGQGQGGGQVS
ncbi:unnamed protein product, partial [Discosporangium mesarthrocarpum]